MKKSRSYSNFLFALFLLGVFFIALIPWNALHHHEAEQEYCTKEGKICMHKTHLGNETHTCLICSTHFIKDFYIAAVSCQMGLQSKNIVRNYTLISADYTALISLSLRGPPAV